MKSSRSCERSIPARSSAASLHEPVARESHGEERGMLLERLREQVVQVGLEALARGIVHGTAGNMSIRDRETGLIAISPSGMPYPSMAPADVVVVNDRGEIMDGSRKP